jgi:hypothetical protein
MTDCQSKIPDRNTDKSQLKQAETLGKIEADQDRAPSGAVTVSDIGSPYGPPDTQYNYESVDFGESGEELI